MSALSAYQSARLFFLQHNLLMSLADHTCGGAAASTVPEDKDVITGSRSNLPRQRNVLRTGRNLIFVDAEVTAGRNDTRVMVAKASSTLAAIGLNVPELLQHDA